MTAENKIQCPECGASISIDDVLTHQLESKLRKELQSEIKVQEAKLQNERAALEERKLKIEETEKNAQIEINKKVNEKLEAEKLEMWKKARLEADKEKESEKKMLEEQLLEKDKKLQEATTKELELRKEKNQLEEAKKSFELEKQRQLDEERKKITEDAEKKAMEGQHFKIAQMQKQLDDAVKAKDELARKLEQGSQQTQGEVLELELEAILKTEFLQDEITPVPKGVNGADIIQKVLDRMGRPCGQIVWESKKTKNWSEGWVQKLKEDQRAAKADLAVIVSSALPEDVKGFAFRDGVWICDIKLVIPLATALRINLETLSREKSLAVGKNEKMEILYSYLTGIEFQQRVESIMEAFSDMQKDIQKERIFFEKQLSQREKHLKKVMTSTSGMYGDLSGLVTLPEMRMLEE